MDEREQQVSMEPSDLYEQLTQLRRFVHARQAEELAQRKRVRPAKTEEEQRLGIYFEEIEPQVGYAVVELNRKGYPTYSSGFWGEHSEYQTIEGDYKLDEETAQKLREMGIEVTIAPSWKYKIHEKQGTIPAGLPEDAKWTTDIRFQPTTASLVDIDARWKQIAAIIPDRGYAAVDWYRTHRST